MTNLRLATPKGLPIEVESDADHPYRLSVTVTLPARTLRGAVEHVHPLPAPRDGATHYLCVGGASVALDDAGAAAIRAALTQRRTAHDQLVASNVPGLDLLRRAVAASEAESSRYREQFTAMMEDGDNDGVNPPRREDRSLHAIADTLRAQYPRASLYLRAEAFAHSNNVHRYGAGKAAASLLEQGGTIDAAREILDHWLPASAKWD